MKRDPGGFVLLLAVCGAALTTGCQTPGRSLSAEDPELAGVLRLLLPAKIEIQRYLTKPYDFDGAGSANGLEVIVSVTDSFGDPVKCLGTFHFELYTMRMASGDRLGQEVANWPVELADEKSMIQYWDRLTRSYRFPLRLRSGALPPGRYILNARLVTPARENLFDSYEFSHGG